MSEKMDLMFYYHILPFLPDVMKIKFRVVPTVCASCPARVANPDLQYVSYFCSEEMASSSVDMGGLLTNLARLVVNEELLRNITLSTNRLSPEEKFLVDTMRASQLRNVLLQKLGVSPIIVAKILDRSELKDLAIRTIEEVEKRDMEEFMRHYIQYTIAENSISITIGVIVVSILFMFPRQIFNALLSCFEYFLGNCSGLIYQSRTKV